MRTQGLITAAIAALAATACLESAENLSETQQAIVGVAFNPASGQSFGNVQVMQTSSGLSVTISPTSSFNEEAYVSINSIVGCPSFNITSPGPGVVSRTCAIWHNCGPGPQVCEQYLAPQQCLQWNPDQTYTFSVSFSPALAQAYACGITVNTSVGARTYNVSGTGVAPPIDIDVTPLAIAFGDVRRNSTSTPATVYVRNAGGQAIAVSSVTVSSGFAIAAGPTGAYSLPVQTTQNYSVTCTPSAIGQLTGQLRVNSNDPATPTSIVNLTCNGVDSALDISPSPLSVTTRVGEPVEREITLFNSGGAAMQLSSVSLSGAGIVPVLMPAPGTVLNPQTGTTARIRFDATDAGEVSGTIGIVYDGGQTRSAAITATAQATSMSLVPDGTFDFGPVCIGQHETQDVAIFANADGGFRVQDVTTPAAPFTLTAPALPAPVQGQGADSVTLGLRAEPVEEGTVTSTIDIATDIPNAPARTLTLSVTGLPPGVTASPAELDLGQAKVNSTTIGQTVEVSNCSTSAVTLSNPRIEGELAADFAIVAEPDLTVPANGSARWLIVAQPHGVGTKTAVFSVDEPGGTRSVMLIANGIDDLLDGDGDVRPSYYSCATGSASAAWPLVLALVPLVRRRRRR